jgi:diaminopimelate epimerase
MGNPHCVIFVDDVDEAAVHTLGPIVEVHPAFPNRTNVEFASVDAQGLIRLRVWERGVGETLACGTGACATMVAAALKCLIGRDATVELPGGELFIHWSEDGHVHMTGPAEGVFTGTLSIPEEDE